jgi:uncharacterized protein (TIGR01319 family)
MNDVVVCVDFGSTFTKAAAVDVAQGRLLATASTPTSAASDLADGLDEVLAALVEVRGAVDRSRPYGDVLACSSAGGGLRLAVVGYERSVTAEAGYRVGLSAGARVEHVSSGALDQSSVTALVRAAPDVVLLVGGTDGGNAEVLVHNAHALAEANLTVPVVVAGNANAAEDVRRMFGRTDVTVTANVLPRIGVLDPRPARDAIRTVFIGHVIGGKHLSERLDLPDLVQAATPDAVLVGVELLADLVGDVVVVDVGGATTDVYSVVTPDPEEASLHREVAGTLWRSRTVEGDLGVRWGAQGVVDAAVAEGLVTARARPALDVAARQRAGSPGLLPATAQERSVDEQLASWAATVALRRHARPQDSGGVRHPGKDLRGVRLVVGSGGVFRHDPGGGAEQLLRASVHDLAGGWKLPEVARTEVDRDYVLAAAGLLGARHPEVARALLVEAFV